MAARGRCGDGASTCTGAAGQRLGAVLQALNSYRLPDKRLTGPNALLFLQTL